jgi:hypothetical protein
MPKRKTKRIVIRIEPDGDVFLLQIDDGNIIPHRSMAAVYVALSDYFIQLARAHNPDAQAQRR